MTPGRTLHRLRQLLTVASAQSAVQLIGFVAGIVLVRYMAPVDYGYFTLAVSLLGAANVLTDLGLAAAVMACGGRLLARHEGLSPLLADANDLHRRLASWTLPLLVPCFAWLLHRLGAPLWQVTALTVLVMAIAFCNVRSLLMLSVVRLAGHVARPQQIELAVNLAKLTLYGAAVWLALTAPLALLVLFGAGLAQLVLLSRLLDNRAATTPGEAGTHTPALGDHVRRQAPNAIYFVFSSQIAVWLIGLFGNAEQVAQVGALGRLAAVFAIVAAVSAALMQPYFARRRSSAELLNVFASVNGFFALILVGLVALAARFPQALLWVLGGHYGGLHTELVWMIVSATLSAWGGALYSLGTVRGWIPPAWLSAVGGIAAAIVAASLVDVSSVRGAYLINTAIAAVGCAIAFGHLALRLRRHTRLEITLA